MGTGTSLLPDTLPGGPAVAGGVRGWRLQHREPPKEAGKANPDGKRRFPSDSTLRALHPGEPRALLPKPWIGTNPPAPSGCGQEHQEPLEFEALSPNPWEKSVNWGCSHLFIFFFPACLHPKQLSEVDPADRAFPHADPLKSALWGRL